MKKSLIFAGIILLALLSGGIYGVKEVTSQKNDVMVYCQTLKGDVKEAEGIRFWMHNNWAEQLYWDTLVTIGGVEEGLVESETIFRSNWKGGAKRSYRFYSPLLHQEEGVELHIENGTSIYSMSKQGISLEDSSIPFVKAAIDVASRVAPGQSRTEVIKLSDYYEYYDIWMEVVSHRSHMWNEADNFIPDFFGMEVPDSHVIEVAISKNEDGAVYNVDFHTINDGGQSVIVSTSHMAKEGVYFSFHCVDNSGKMVNMKSQVGNGIFFLPLEGTGEDDGSLKVLVSDMKKVYSLPSEDCFVMEVQMDETQERLFILTREADQVVLRVLDASTMEERQKISLTDATDVTALKQMDQVDDAVWVLLTDGTFCYLTKGDDGSLQKQNTGSLGGGPQLDGHDSARPLSYDLDYQEGKLVIVCEESYYGNSAFVYVFEGDTLLYKGYFLHSGDYEKNFTDHGYLNEETPLEIIAVRACFLGYKFIIKNLNFC